MAQKKDIGTCVLQASDQIKLQHRLLPVEYGFTICRNKKNRKCRLGKPTTEFDPESVSIDYSTCHPSEKLMGSIHTHSIFGNQFSKEDINTSTRIGERLSAITTPFHTYWVDITELSSRDLAKLKSLLKSSDKIDYYYKWKSDIPFKPQAIQQVMQAEHKLDIGMSEIKKKIKKITHII